MYRFIAFFFLEVPVVCHCRLTAFSRAARLHHRTAARAPAGRRELAKGVGCNAC